MNVVGIQSDVVMLSTSTELPRNLPLVIGLGQTLRRDDGVGQRVVERLMDGSPGRIATAVVTQLLPEWSVPIARASALVVVDATVAGVPGEVAAHPLLPSREGSAMSHEMSPGQMLTYASELWGRAPPAILVTIAGANFGLGESLSPEVERAIPEAVDVIHRWLAPFCSVDMLAV